MMMREAVILAALDGDSKSQALYFSKLQQSAFLPDFASWSAPRRPHESEPLPPHVAEATIAAGLAAPDRPAPEPDLARPTGPEGRPN